MLILIELNKCSLNSFIYYYMPIYYFKKYANILI